MIATIRRVWPGEKRTTVIVSDAADHREKACFVWGDTTKGQLIAALCEQLEKTDRRVVLTVKPRHRHFGFEIEEAEVMPAEAHAS